MRDQADVLAELNRIATALQDGGVVLRGNGVELMLLREVQPTFFDELTDVGVPEHAPEWASAMAKLAATIVQCTREGYISVQYGMDWIVESLSGEQLRLPDVEYRLFSLFVDRLSAASLPKLTVPV